MTHPLVEMWRKDPHTRAFHHYADALESLLTTVYTDPPSIEAFRAHTTAHGFDKYDQRYGWLRVKCYSGWVQASCRVVDPSTWEGWRGDKAPYVLCELFQGSKGSLVNSVSFDHGVIEWQWCDSMGIPVPPPEVMT